MPRYVLLVDWSEEGVRAVEHTVDRLEQGTRLGESLGCTVEHAWWTQGGHDMVSVISAPDEQAMVAYTPAVMRQATFGPRRCVPGVPMRCGRSSAGYPGSRKRR
jgi:uncharacterized protein with GYD domain